MKSVELPPYAPTLIESTRAIGYSLEAAIADIIDNSIAAVNSRDFFSYLLAMFHDQMMRKSFRYCFDTFIMISIVCIPCPIEFSEHRVILIGIVEGLSAIRSGIFRTGQIHSTQCLV